MRFLVSTTLLTALLTGSAFAQIAEVPVNEAGEPEQYNLQAKVSVTFPDNDSPLGVTFVNGRVARINLEVENFESEPITVEAIGGALRKNDRSIILRNLTAAKVSQVIPSLSTVEVPYSFVPNMHAQDVVFELGVLFSSKEGGKVVQYTAYNSTISVAEPPTSLLDPQVLFLYLILTGLVAGGGYLAYQTWVVPMLPKPKRVRTVPVESKTSSADVPKGTVDESWIPEHHLKRPVAQKVRSSGGTPKAKAKKGE